MINSDEWVEFVPGKYAINRIGDVKSIERIDSLGRKQGGFLIKKTISNEGYYRVSLRPEKKQIHFSIHRLLAIAFIPNPENKPCINHKNSNRQDNSLSNLEWVTFSENNSHAHISGAQPKHYGEKHHQSKLNWDKVREIRGMYVKRKYPLRKMAKHYEVSVTTLQAVLKNKTWKYEYHN